MEVESQLKSKIIKKRRAVMTSVDNNTKWEKLLKYIMILIVLEFIVKIM